MEIGKLYKSIHTGMVVRCTIPRFGESFSGIYFGGVVVEKGGGDYEIGHKLDSWFCTEFEEYKPTQELVIGNEYTIPNGCKAIIEDGKVKIEPTQKYYKHDFGEFIRYSKYVEGGRTTIITLCCNGDMKILHLAEKPYSETGKGVAEIDEIEFMEVYKKALKNIGL